MWIQAQAFLHASSYLKQHHKIPFYSPISCQFQNFRTTTRCLRSNLLFGRRCSYKHRTTIHSEQKHQKSWSEKKTTTANLQLANLTIKELKFRKGLLSATDYGSECPSLMQPIEYSSLTWVTWDMLLRCFNKTFSTLVILAPLFYVGVVYS